ncbi:MAG: glycosyltransferase [Sphingobacteriaceae bacterium]|nr:MAG: glycosyltransferase [Sphingobacteriaceae bacterium]
MALLSIIVPVYNKEAYIDACVKSILQQTVSDFELILVDDGSTDGSSQRCDAFAVTDKRVIVIHQENQGVSAARNAGIDAAKGDYIGFVDCDDEIDADMYEVLIDTMLKHQADISICGIRKIFPDKTQLYYGTGAIYELNSAQAIDALFKKYFARSVYDKLFKAEIARQIRFEGSINEDTFYNFLTFFKARKVVFNDIIKYNYIIRENSVSMTKFSAKYLDMIAFSKRMVEICAAILPVVVEEAQYFDLVNNITLLNLILISGKQNFRQEYALVASNLKAYKEFVKKGAIRAKHKYAYDLFLFSPKLYELMMIAYCKLTAANAVNKK